MIHDELSQNLVLAIRVNAQIILNMALQEEDHVYSLK